MEARQLITLELIKTAFRLTGLSPFNPDIFTNEDFAPSKASSVVAHFPQSYPEEVQSSSPFPTDMETEQESSDSSDDELPGSRRGSICS